MVTLHIDIGTNIEYTLVFKVGTSKESFICVH